MNTQYWKKGIAGTILIAIGLISWVLATNYYIHTRYNYQPCLYGSFAPIFIGVLYLIPKLKIFFNDLRVVIFGCLYAALLVLIFSFGLNLVAIWTFHTARQYPYRYPFYLFSTLFSTGSMLSVFVFDALKFKLKPLLGRIVVMVAVLVPLFYTIAFFLELVGL